MKQLRARREEKEASYRSAKYSASPISDHNTPIRVPAKSPIPREENHFPLFGEDAGQLNHGDNGGTNLVEIKENSDDSLTNSEDDDKNKVNKSKNK